MAAITDRSTKAPLLELGILTHGTLHCLDVVKTRRFYEEVLGIEVIQTSPISLLVRKGTHHTYAVVEQPAGAHPPMNFFNHNGFAVRTKEEVSQARELLMQIKDEWGLPKVMPINHMHGDTSFYFQDFDGNWWEIGVTSDIGYSVDFDEKETSDLTGMHVADGWVDTYVKQKKLLHLHDPNARALLSTLKASHDQV